MTINESLEASDVMSEGYGIIPTNVMTDSELSIESKAIYAFFASHLGSGETSLPNVETMADILGISATTFNKHRKALEDKGYIA